jgi:hypothetical protein
MGKRSNKKKCKSGECICEFGESIALEKSFEGEGEGGSNKKRICIIRSKTLWFKWKQKTYFPQYSISDPWKNGQFGYFTIQTDQMVPRELIEI